MKWLTLSLMIIILFSGCVDSCMTNCLKKLGGTGSRCGHCEITHTSCDAYCSGKSDSPTVCYVVEGCEDFIGILCEDVGGFCNQTCSGIDTKIDCPGNEICCVE